MTVDRREVVVLDVNETLLDLRALAPRFEKLLPPALMGVWFSRMLRNSLVALATGQYAPFDRQGVDALLTTASSAGVEVTEAEAVEVIAGMNELPPHPDVVPALGQLAGARIRMATLTNSALGVATAQVRNAGLESSSKPCCRSTRFAPSNRRRRLTGSPQRNSACRSAASGWWPPTIGMSPEPSGREPAQPSSLAAVHRSVLSPRFRTSSNPT